MATLTIQKGQTLSGIAKSNGTTVDVLLKANPSIKDPNKIYAGANLSLPEAPKTPLVSPGASGTPQSPTGTPTTPVTTRVDQLGSSGASPVPQKSTLYGAEVPSSTSLLTKYRSELGLDSALKSMQDNQTSYLDTLKNLPKKADIYAQEKSKLGIDVMQKNLQSLDDRLATMELSIEDSEKDIRNRMVQGGGLVTESQTQRLVASEKQPLIDEYRKLLNERNRLADKLGVADTSAKESAGVQYDIGGTKVTGKKVSSGSDGGGSSSDVEAYALELLNNPNFTASNVPQNIRAQVLQKRDQIIAEANTQQQADTAAAQALKASQPKITAQDFGAGVKDVFTQQIPNLAKSGYNTGKSFLKGLFGIGN